MEAVKFDLNSGDYFQVIVQKDGFDTETLMVPAGRFIPLKTYVDVRLISGNSEIRVAAQIVQNLLNAQKFANKGEFERAQVEIDKVLAVDPNFARALSMRGSIYYIQSRFEESLIWYEKALSVDPSLEDALIMITEVKKKISKQ
jgi:tetratricopeptide (TPR) repeat protein